MLLLTVNDVEDFTLHDYTSSWLAAAASPAVADLVGWPHLLYFTAISNHSCGCTCACIPFLLPLLLLPLPQVLANPLVPQPNKDAAQQRYDKLHAACLDTISRWAAATTASLQPTATA
mgnify:CR=1 FL=1